MGNYLFQNATVVTMNEFGEVLHNTDVAVENGKIVNIGQKCKYKEKKYEIIDCTNKLLIPGLVNSHSHLPMSLLRNYAEDVSFKEWLFKKIGPKEDMFDAQCVRAGTLLSLAESLAFGCTSISDMYFYSEDIAKAVAEVGIKANISRGLTCDDNFQKLKSDKRGKEAISLFENWHNYNDGQIIVDMSIHGEYTSTPVLWHEVADFAAKRNLIIQIHLSESYNEHMNCIEKYGKTPTEIFNEHRVLDCNVTAAHCVWVTPKDMQILSEHGVNVVHNPVSNLKLANGIADLKKMKKYGLNVSLGTDGAASNNNLDMFEEIKMASLLQKGITQDPEVITAYEALKMATINGAISQGREKTTGSIEIGKEADIVAIELKRPNNFPLHDPIATIVYSTKASDVTLTMVKGKILYQNGEWKTIDIERVYSDITSYVNKRIGF